MKKDCIWQLGRLARQLGRLCRRPPACGGNVYVLDRGDSDDGDDDCNGNKDGDGRDYGDGDGDGDCSPC